MQQTKVVGQTKGVGFQIGVRRTFSVPVDLAWNFLFSEGGLSIWLCKVNPGDFEPGKAFKTKEGVEGKVNVLKLNSHTRLTWKRKDWENLSTVQMRVMPTKEKTTISFHQEKLIGSSQREEMRSYWRKILEEIKNKFDSR